jgi:hypothetical protein
VTAVAAFWPKPQTFLRVKSPAANRTYYLERGTNIGEQPSFLTLATDILGQSGMTVYTDTNAVGSRVFLYRVGIQEP